MNLNVFDLEIDVSCETSVNFQHISENATPGMEFARCHHLTQPWYCDLKKNTQRDMSEVLRLPRKMTIEVSKLLRLPWKMQLLLQQRRESIAPVTQNDFRDVMKHVGMSQSDKHAKRNEATRHLKHTKKTTDAKLAIGTAMRPSRGRLRTAANGCERLCNAWRTQPQPPKPPEWNGNPRYAFGKNGWKANHKMAISLDFTEMGMYQSNKLDLINL